jgi:hypothetical protein
MAELYSELCRRARAYGIEVREKQLEKDKAGEFDGPTVTINIDNNAAERALFLAHSIGSVARWSLAAAESAAVYAELRAAKKSRQQDGERFERALAGFCAFEEMTSEHAVWLLADLDFPAAIAPYTEFARADLDAMVAFHRTGEAPIWREFFAHWKQQVAAHKMMVRPYQPRPIPPFRPVRIEAQEIVQEKQ